MNSNQALKGEWNLDKLRRGITRGQSIRRSSAYAKPEQIWIQSCTKSISYPQPYPIQNYKVIRVILLKPPYLGFDVSTMKFTYLIRNHGIPKSLKTSNSHLSATHPQQTLLLVQPLPQPTLFPGILCNLNTPYSTFLFIFFPHHTHCLLTYYIFGLFMVHYLPCP